MNCAIAPALIRPAITSDAPIHSTPTTPAEMKKMTISVSAERATMRRRAASKAASTLAPKARIETASCVIDCTVWAACSTSPALAALSAIRSWLSRLRRRTRRPSTRIGTTTSGTSSSVIAVSFSEVTISMIMPPNSSSTLRSAIETVEPTTVWMIEVSTVSRLSTSAVIRRS